MQLGFVSSSCIQSNAVYTLEVRHCKTPWQLLGHDSEVLQASIVLAMVKHDRAEHLSACFKHFRIADVSYHDHSPYGHGSVGAAYMLACPHRRCFFFQYKQERTGAVPLPSCEFVMVML